MTTTDELGGGESMGGMVERVARVLCHELYAADYEGDRVDLFVAKYWEDHVSDARAAIAAMREPSLVMSAAGGGRHCGNDYMSLADFPEQAREIWHAMIDAALKPESP